MKSHVWIKHNNFNETIEITIRDFSGAKIETWRVTCNDKKRQKQIFKAIKDKHGINLFFEFEEKDKDLSWLE